MSKIVISNHMSIPDWTSKKNCLVQCVRTLYLLNPAAMTSTFLGLILLCKQDRNQTLQILLDALCTRAIDVDVSEDATILVLVVKGE